MFVGHKCDTVGCNSVIVIDGNLKNHQDVWQKKQGM